MIMSLSNLSNKHIVFRRSVSEEDVECIAKLWYDVYQESHAHLVPPELLKDRTLDTFRIRVKNPVFMEGTIMAMVIVNSGPEETERLLGFITSRLESYEVYQLFVAKEARSLGVASKLLQRAEEDFKCFEMSKNGSFCSNPLDNKSSSKKHITLHLHASVGNYTAKRFYEKNGWKTVNEEMFQAEVVVDEKENIGQLKNGESVSRIQYFPLHCYRIEKVLALE